METEVAAAAEQVITRPVQEVPEQLVLRVKDTTAAQVEEHTLVELVAEQELQVAGHIRLVAWVSLAQYRDLPTMQAAAVPVLTMGLVRTELVASAVEAQARHKTTLRVVQL